MDEVASLEHVIVRLRTGTRQHAETGAPQPHPRAAELIRPDGVAAPAELRCWAGYDNRYPWYLSNRRSDREIASAEGVLLAEPMSVVLRRIVVDSVLEEYAGVDDIADIDDDDEDVAEQRVYLEELYAGFLEELPGYGVDLIPFEYPHQILWIPPTGSPQVLRYDREEFNSPEPFTQYVIRLFADD